MKQMRAAQIEERNSTRLKISRIFKKEQRWRVHERRISTRQKEIKRGTEEGRGIGGAIISVLYGHRDAVSRGVARNRKQRLILDTLSR